ncbi:transcription elongation factor GreA [Patescibacteria group bacterium]|nr:transcription elongation factor GreA [Patescibacteria group bacterium]
MTNQILLTIEGKEKLEKEVKELKEVRMPDIIEKIEQAKELGDLSENAEYHSAKEQQGLVAGRIAEIEDVLKKGLVVDSSTSKEEIRIGTTFVVEDVTGNAREFSLVGFSEADPGAGRISNESPMGQAFMNKKPGDTVEVDAPRGAIVYKVLEIK